MKRTLLFLALAAMTPALAAHAQDITRLKVHAVSNDAKIIGSAVGGARIVVTDVATGEILSEGIQRGGTGETRRIMVTRPERGTEPVYDTEGAASYMAELAITEPTWVDVTAYAPLGAPDAVRQSTKRMLVLPGRDVLGDGVVLELNGFTVQLESPAELLSVAAGEPIPVRATVTMLCGCPTSPGGMWDSDGYEISASLMRDGEQVEFVYLDYAGQTSTFTGEVPNPGAGTYTLRILAADPDQANFGMAEETVVVR